MEIDDVTYDVRIPANAVTFSGAPAELPAFLMHVRLQKGLDSDLRSKPMVEAAYMASLLRGSAMDWFVRTLPSQPTIDQDPELLRTLLEEVFGETEEVRKAQAQKKITHLHQTGTVTAFVAEFESLADYLEWPVSAKEAFFFQGLKPQIKAALIHVQMPDYTATRDAAKRIEALLAVASGSHIGASSAKKKKKATTCQRCGRKNHAAADCHAKTNTKGAALNMIRSDSGKDLTPESQYIQVEVYGHTLRALVDTGAEVNCISTIPEGMPSYPSTMVIRGPTGQPLATDARYVVATIDGTPQRLYHIPELSQSLVLGQPYLNNQHNVGTCTFALTGQPDDGGRLRRLTPTEEEALDQYLADAIQQGWIAPSSAERACNILFVPKKNGKLRMCVDYRPVNKVTKRDAYPLPLLWDLVLHAANYEYFTVLDVNAAFHQIAIQPGQEPITAFKTPRGVFEYKVMPFGITNGPAIFQRKIDSVLQPHQGYARAYIDDIIIFGHTEEECADRTKAVLATLLEHGLSVASDKSQTLQQEVVYLGHKVRHGCVEAIVHTDTVHHWPEPKGITELQSFLGLANWFREFIPGFATAAAPLYSKTGKQTWDWSLQDRAAFSEVKAAMLRHLEINIQQPDVPIDIFTDASLFGIGAIAFQNARPIAILSRALTPAERNYTTTERELLAVVHTCRKWRPMIETSRRTVTIYTDHKILTQRWNADYSNRRMNRWLETLQSSPVLYQYVQGKLNPADFPSRRPDFSPGWGGEEEVNRLTAAATSVVPWWHQERNSPETPLSASTWTPSLHSEEWSQE